MPLGFSLEPRPRRTPNRAAQRAAMMLAAFAALAGATLLAQDGKQTLAVGALFALVAIGLLLWRTRDERHEAARVRHEYLAGMGHELRTPLNSVIGFSNVLLKTARSRLTAQELEYLGRVRASGEQLLHVVDELLRSNTTTTTTYAMSHHAPRPTLSAPASSGASLVTGASQSNAPPLPPPPTPASPAPQPPTAER